MGAHTVTEDDLAKISTKAQEVRTVRTVRAGVISSVLLPQA